MLITRINESAQQVWPPFVLVSGLLMIGVVAHADGLFESAGRVLERLPGPPAALLCAGIVLVAVVTAILNLDTAVVFLTPVLVLAARARQVDERPFLYGAVYLANASSLYLPGSNLTNLLVLAHTPLSGGTFAAQMLGPALAATVVTAAGVLLLFRRELRGGRRGRASTAVREGSAGIGLCAATAAAGLTLALANPALPVLGVGVVAVGLQVARGRLVLSQVVRALGPIALGTLLLASVALGTLARAWDGPAQLLAGAGRWETAAIASLGAIAVNNLPASVLLSARAPAHPRALLIGLDLGPNLAVSGSLAAYLWLRAARQVGARPSITAFSRRGVVLAPLAIVGALLAATALGAPG